MAIRARKTKSRPSTAAKKKAVIAKKKLSDKGLSPNGKAHLKTYKDLEKKLGEAWKKLCQDVEKKDKKAILQDRNELMLLLGECHYMAKECANCLENKPKRKTR